MANNIFDSLPAINIERSSMRLDHSLATTFNAGKLVPIYWTDVMPGDTVKADINSIIRMATPLHPVMDNCFLDIHCFFVPNRLVWKHWVNLMGENTTDAWSEPEEYQIPQWRVIPKPGSLADYLGLPTMFDQEMEVSALPARAYSLIWNEWYRDQNLQDPQLVSLDDTTDQPASHGLLPVNRYKDYFSSCLPQPQKGAPVALALGSLAPVYTKSDMSVNVTDPLKLANTSGEGFGILIPRDLGVVGLDSNTATLTSFPADSNQVIGNSTGSVAPKNLFADLSEVSSVTVNALRQAFAVQRLLEADMYGTRYRELVLSHFRVHTGDARVQVPEYLGGKHIPINVQQVIQQSSTADEPTVLGNTGAFSKTVDSDHYFTKSFTEHGIFMVLASVRVSHSYQQGIPRKFSRKGRYDFYWPELAHIGNTPVFTKELYSNVDPDQVFGYQEAWSEYRYEPNRVSGDMRSGINGSLDVWHYADDYQSVPYLSASWMAEGDELIGRTLAVRDSDLSDQFIANFYFDFTFVRPMPIHSVPGLTGHF